ncbi:MAG: formate/nitrite transporter family protein [bacterium]|nr:formate/nitrite transporter family protein [bacterium]
MEKMYFTQSEIVDNTIHDYAKKANYNVVKMALYGLMAGMFIAIGAQGSLVSIHNISDPGIAKTVAGVVFPIGLMLIVLIGGQLFTGNCLLFMSAWDKQISWAKVAKNLAIIWVTNLLGAIFIAAMCYFSGQYDFNHGALGAYTIKNAVAKANTVPYQGFLSGILCNITVCGAILMAGSAKDVAGKILGIFFTIFVFVISGFEHCIANAYYLPAGLFAKMNSEYVDLAKETYHLTAEQIDSLSVSNAFLHNLFPVTIGNIIGGGIIVGGLMFLCHKNKKLS